MLQAPNPNSVARFVRWAIILFFAYAVWHSFGAPNPPVLPQHAVLKEKDCNHTPQQNFPAISLPMLPAIMPMLHVEDTKIGTGEPAVCGQTASVRYEYATRDNKVIFKSAAPENIIIGAGELLRGAELGLIGMKPGSERSITMSPSLAFSKNHPLQLPDAKEPVTAKVALLGLSPDVPSSPMPVRVIDTRFGNGPRAQCGDTVTADITIWKLDGTKLFSTLDSKPVTFTLGKSEQIPLGIEQATMGMTTGGERTLIAPPAFTRPLLEPIIKHKEPVLIPIQFPEHEMVLVEITRLPAVKESAATPVKK